MTCLCLKVNHIKWHVMKSFEFVNCRIGTLLYLGRGYFRLYLSKKIANLHRGKKTINYNIYWRNSCINHWDYSRNNVYVTQTWRDVIMTYRKQDQDMTIDMLVKFQTCFDHWWPLICTSNHVCATEMLFIL